MDRRVTLRIPIPLLDDVDASARRLGLSRNDYLVLAAAYRVGRDDGARDIAEVRREIAVLRRLIHRQ